MSGLERLIQAAMNAPKERRDAALEVLAGQAVAVEPGTPPPISEPYLTREEVARRLGFRPITLWRWRIPGHQIGSQRRFRLSEVEAYLRSEEFQRRQAALRAERRHQPQTQ
ncbi:MAG: helix-turn-helix domain-containing protein [Verrucomicrobiales bacterium]|nr:helix-turn-helix domain-containing protein [Planctomycetota bacterium]MCP5524107.1 helix-turn-helix domain-containing protein [Verrucomicrobiales bacterium]